MVYKLFFFQSYSFFALPIMKTVFFWYCRRINSKFWFMQVSYAVFLALSSTFGFSGCVCPHWFFIFLVKKKKIVAAAQRKLEKSFLNSPSVSVFFFHPHSLLLVIDYISVKVEPRERKRQRSQRSKPLPQTSHCRAITFTSSERNKIKIRVFFLIFK